jgi:SAM-dependent MidA family methyltransferase
VSQLFEKIAKEIEAAGPISFARFMELALYCPVYGYYEKEEDTVGRQGDFYTSVSVGSLFGELLAWQFAEWLTGVHTPQSGEARCALPRGARLQLVEAGAHRGELARDILSWLSRQRRELFEQIEYWIVEPSDRRRGWQQQTLAEFKERVYWAETFVELGHALAPRRPSPVTDHPIRGLVFSNELLDALPVHRLGWDAARRQWFEWGVKLADRRFVWARLPELDSRCTSQLSRLGAHAADLPLPDGFTLEICPAAEIWWREAAGALGCGKLLTIDYGLTTPELLLPERCQGTLRAYRQHRPAGDVLADPGQQDLTAHVNFSAIQEAGESAGLKTEAFLTQTQFLTNIAAQIWNSDTQFGEWTPKHTRQFQTLTHPEHLGRAFRVLVQSAPSIQAHSA